MRTQAPSDHLDVQGRAQGRSAHQHAIDGGAVPALGEHPDVADDLQQPGFEVRQHAPPVRLRHFRVDAAGGEACGRERPGQLFGVADGDREHDDVLPALAVSAVGVDG